MCYVSHLKAVPGKGMLIIWDWTYHLDEEDSLNDNSDNVSDCSDGVIVVMEMSQVPKGVWISNVLELYEIQCIRLFLQSCGT